VPVAVIIDSDSAKAGGQVEGVSIVSPDALQQDASTRPFVLVASRQGDVIAEQLEAMGWQAARDYHVSDLDVAQVADIEAAWRSDRHTDHHTK
jgi:hypothetical protein